MNGNESNDHILRCHDTTILLLILFFHFVIRGLSGLHDEFAKSIEVYSCVSSLVDLIEMG